MTRKLAPPKPAIQPPKAGRQSDRFVKTWLESLSGRLRWGGSLGWNLKSIFEPNRQTSKQENWQSDWLRRESRDGGQTKDAKTVLMMLFLHFLDRTAFNTLLTDTWIFWWDQRCYIFPWLKNSVTNWMNPWFVKCNECYNITRHF